VGDDEPHLCKVAAGLLRLVNPPQLSQQFGVAALHADLDRVAARRRHELEQLAVEVFGPRLAHPAIAEAARHNPLAEVHHPLPVMREDRVAKDDVRRLDLADEPLPFGQRALDALTAELPPLRNDIGAERTPGGAAAAAQEAHCAVRLPGHEIPGGQGQRIEVSQQAVRPVELRAQGSRLDAAHQSASGYTCHCCRERGLRLAGQRSLRQPLGQPAIRDKVCGWPKQQTARHGLPPRQVCEQAQEVVVAQPCPFADEQRDHIRRLRSHAAGELRRIVLARAVHHSDGQARAARNRGAQRNRVRRIEEGALTRAEMTHAGGGLVVRGQRAEPGRNDEQQVRHRAHRNR